MSIFLKNKYFYLEIGFKNSYICRNKEKNTLVRGRLTFIFFVILFLFSYNLCVYSQECIESVKKFCDKSLFDDFDFVGQSSYGSLLPGDSQTVTVILQAEMDYRIIFCADPKLGDVIFLINQEYKEYIPKTIGELKPRIEVVYEKDEYGNEKYDLNGNPIIKEEKTVYDTVWIPARTVKRAKQLYDSRTAPTVNYWETPGERRARYITISVIVPHQVEGGLTNRVGAYGCVNILVGKRFARRNGKLNRF